MQQIQHKIQDIHPHPQQQNTRPLKKNDCTPPSACLENAVFWGGKKSVLFLVNILMCWPDYLCVGEVFLFWFILIKNAGVPLRFISSGKASSVQSSSSEIQSTFWFTYPDSCLIPLCENFTHKLMRCKGPLVSPRPCTRASWYVG